MEAILHGQIKDYDISQVKGLTESLEDKVSNQALEEKLSEKQDTLTFDDIPKEGSNNPVKSSGIFSELQRKSNENLLDNWYFVGGSQQGGGQFPINQRGQTEYSSNGYCIDGWMYYSNDPAKNFQITLKSFTSAS